MGASRSAPAWDLIAAAASRRAVCDDLKFSMAGQSLSLRVALQGLLFSLRAEIKIMRAGGSPIGPRLLEVANKAASRAESARSMALLARTLRPGSEAKLDAIVETMERVLEALRCTREHAAVSADAQAAENVLVAAARDLEDLIHRPARDPDPHGP